MEGKSTVNVENLFPPSHYLDDPFLSRGNQYFHSQSATVLYLNSLLSKINSRKVSLCSAQFIQPERYFITTICLSIFVSLVMPLHAEQSKLNTHAGELVELISFNLNKNFPRQITSRNVDLLAGVAWTYAGRNSNCLRSRQLPTCLNPSQSIFLEERIRYAR